MTAKEPMKLTKLIVKHPFKIILIVIVLFYLGYLFGQFLFEILN